MEGNFANLRQLIERAELSLLQVCSEHLGCTNEPVGDEISQQVQGNLLHLLLSKSRRIRLDQVHELSHEFVDFTSLAVFCVLLQYFRDFFFQNLLVVQFCVAQEDSLRHSECRLLHDLWFRRQKRLCDHLITILHEVLDKAEFRCALATRLCEEAQFKLDLLRVTTDN